MAMRPQPDSITPQLRLMVRPSEHFCLHSCIKHVHEWDVVMHGQHGFVRVLAKRLQYGISCLVTCTVPFEKIMRMLC